LVAAIAAASDGSVLINVVSLLPTALQRRLSQHLGRADPIFVGIPLSGKEAEAVVARLDDAAAEAAALVLGRRQLKTATPSLPSVKGGPGAAAPRKRSNPAQR